MMTLIHRLMRQGHIGPASHVQVVEVLLPATESTPSGWGLGSGNGASLKTSSVWEFSKANFNSSSSIAWCLTWPQLKHV